MLHQAPRHEHILCLTKHYAVKIYDGVEVKLHSAGMFTFEKAILDVDFMIFYVAFFSLIP
jgi:hypothetical protein